MEHSNEQEHSCVPIPFRNHTALLLSVALPYLHPAYRHPVELALKFLEFSETMRLFREFHLQGNSAPFSPGHSPQNNDTGFFGLINTYITDLEGLLTSLSSVCTGDEKEVLGMFLNLIRAKNFYHTYGDLFSAMQGSLGEPSNTTLREEPAPNLSSMLNPEQNETLELLKSLFSNEL